MSRLLNGDFIFSEDLTNNGELDLRYTQKTNLTGFNEYIKDEDIINLNKYVQVNEIISTPDFNNGAGVSGQNLIVKDAAVFRNGVDIKGKLILNGKEVLVNADGVLYSPSFTVG